MCHEKIFVGLLSRCQFTSNTTRGSRSFQAEENNLLGGAFLTTGILAQSVKWIETNLMCLILLLFFIQTSVTDSKYRLFTGLFPEVYRSTKCCKCIATFRFTTLDQLCETRKSSYLVGTVVTLNTCACHHCDPGSSSGMTVVTAWVQLLVVCEMSFTLHSQRLVVLPQGFSSTLRNVPNCKVICILTCLIRPQRLGQLCWETSKHSFDC